MSPTSLLISSLGQFLCVFIFALTYFAIHYMLFLRKTDQRYNSFFQYLGFHSFKHQIDFQFFIIMLLFSVFAIISTSAEFHFSPSMRLMLISNSSPYWKILKDGLNTSSLTSGLIYCFFMASASEELLFRGLFARRLFSSLGHLRGNIIQSLIFWLMHLIIFRLMSNEWFSYVQLITFFTSFGMGLVLGYVNYRKNGESFGPSWILHGTANFITFLTLAYLYSH